MTVLALDTHATIKRLITAGMSEGQAEAVTSVVREAQTTTTDGLATSADLREQELRLEAKLADLKAELMKWMIGALGLQTLAILGGLAALITLMSH